MFKNSQIIIFIYFVFLIFHSVMAMQDEERRSFYPRVSRNDWNLFIFFS